MRPCEAHYLGEKNPEIKLTETKEFCKNLHIPTLLSVCSNRFMILLYILTWPYVVKRVSIFLWQGAFLFKGYCAISSKPTKQIEHAWRNLHWNLTLTSTRQYWNIWRRQWFSRSCGQNSNVADKKQHYLRFFFMQIALSFLIHVLKLPPRTNIRPINCDLGYCRSESRLQSGWVYTFVWYNEMAPKIPNVETVALPYS